MCDLIIYLRKGLGDKSRDHTNVQSLNLIASNISCLVNHRPFASRTPVIFESDQLHPWPSGLVIREKLLAVKQGK